MTKKTIYHSLNSKIMKIIQNITLAIILGLITFTIGSCQTKKDNNTAKFKVYGNCNMCKKTIDNSLDVKGVKSANWNTESKMIEIVYQPEKISEDKLHELIASSGYDTEKKKGDNNAYNNLPGCCQYERKK
jgi:mercuric ion binding protein